MSLEVSVVQGIIDLKQEDDVNRNNPIFNGVFLSNRDVSEKIFGVRTAESSVRRVWREYKQFGHYRGIVGSDPIAGGNIEASTIPILQGKKFVITSAQNNTHIHEDFFNSLLKYCEAEGAELLISTFHYNKSGFQNAHDNEIWFDKRIKPYFINEGVQLADGLIFNAELNILPTARNPCSGFDTYNGDASGIIPHVKMELQPLPSPKYDEARCLYTTGTITQRNYRQQKAGQLAEWDHIFGALVVEVNDSGDWFVRQLHAESKTGNFYDLNSFYTPKGKSKEEFHVCSIQFGDIHRDKLRKETADMCWNAEDSIAATLAPEYAFLEDVHDQSRRNHHNMKDPYYLFKQFTDKKECLKEEVRLSVDLFLEVNKYCENIVVVSSNHDLALERFLKEQDYKRDPVNAIFFLEMQLANYKSIESGIPLETFKTACEFVSNEYELDNVQFLLEDEPFRMHGIEMGAHGHLGNNGARGSALSFRKQGIKFNIGHSHSPLIKGGVYQAGACVLVGDVGYAKGGSSWAIGHIITYQNGKRTIITCKNNKWKA